MAIIIQREAVVEPEGKVEISAPELVMGQRVKVTIEPQPEQQETLAQRQHVIDIIKDLPGHRLFKTAEDVDAYIREERDSWER